MKNKIALKGIIPIFVAMLFLLPPNAIFTNEFFEKKTLIKETAEPPTPIFYVPFDESVNATIAQGEPIPLDHINWEDYGFTDGIRGKSLSKPADITNYVLSYHESYNLNPEQGTIEFWIRLKERKDKGTYFFQHQGNQISIKQCRPVPGYPDQIEFKFKGDILSTWWTTETYPTVDFTLTRGWVGEWHQIVFTWKWKHITTATNGLWAYSVKVYIDGYYKPLRNTLISSPISGTRFYIGAHGGDRAYADIDELKIYDVPLTEEQVRRNYMALFPVEYYAKETVFKIYGKQTIPLIMNVDITNIREGFIPSNIKGLFKCQVDDQTPATINVDLDEGEKATLTVQFVALEIGEYNLNCTFIPDGAPEGRYNRTIKLFVVNGNPTPHPPSLNLQHLLTINCINNHYSGPIAGTVDYCQTIDGTTIPNNQYRQSGLSGATTASTPSCNSTNYENVSNKDSFDSPKNAYQDDGQYAVAESDDEQIYKDFNIPTDLIPQGAEISIKVILKAKVASGGDYGYFFIYLSWDNGTNWSTYDYPLASWNTTSWVYKEIRREWEHTWVHSDLSNQNFQVKLKASGVDIHLDWCGVEIYWEGLFSRFAYKFQIQNENNPHLIVVNYPDDKMRIMGIDLSSESPHSEPGRQIPEKFYQIETGVFTGGEYPNTNEFKQHTIYFWPRDTTYMITFVNWLAAPVGAGAAVRNISVYEIIGDEITGWFPKTNVFKPPDGGRMLGLWWEQNELPDSFCAFNESFREYYKAILNAMDYLHFTGQNLLIYNIWQYAPPHYPSRAERNIYNLWPPVRDRPWPADWFELLLKVAEVNDVNVIPSLTITSIPSLDVIEDGYTVDLIKEKMLNIVDDILKQYGYNPAFKGISLNIWAVYTINERLIEQDEHINGLLEDINTRIQQEGRPDLKLVVSCWFPSIALEDPYAPEWDLDDWKNWLGPKEGAIYWMYKKWD
jgi:hypothetical protein